MEKIIEQAKQKGPLFILRERILIRNMFNIGKDLKYAKDQHKFFHSFISGGAR